MMTEERATPFWLGVVLVTALLGGCREQRTVAATPDAGNSTGERRCNNHADCMGQGLCTANVCRDVISCTGDQDCEASGQVCHANRFYCVECDGTHAGECPSGTTCQFDFTCVPIGGGSDAGPGDGASTECMGSCSNRDECAAAGMGDRVCKNNTCCPPPRRCLSPEDCPSTRPECNGASGECFGGDGCFDDMDCDGRPGCPRGACACEIGAAPPGVCRVRPDECASDMDCYDNGQYVGRFCTLSNPPRRCLPAPMCTSDLQCANEGLVCDTMMGSPSFGRCVNGRPCPMGNECGAGQVCVNTVCVAQNCVNTPSICGMDETCDPTTGMCRPMQGGACMIDGDCQAGFYCNLRVTPSRCEPGCRSNADCPGGVCDANNQCQFAMGGICGPCMTDMDCTAGTRCISVTGQCHETCSMVTGQMCTDAARQCLFGICSCTL